MDLQNSPKRNSWLLQPGMNQVWHNMTVTDVSFYSCLEKRTLTFRILWVVHKGSYNLTEQIKYE